MNTPQFDIECCTQIFWSRIVEFSKIIIDMHIECKIKCSSYLMRSYDKEEYLPFLKDWSWKGLKNKYLKIFEI